MQLISITFFVFQLDISGNDFKDEQSLNKARISTTYSVNQSDIPFIDIKDLHPSNKLLILVK